MIGRDVLGEDFYRESEVAQIADPEIRETTANKPELRQDFDYDDIRIREINLRYLSFF
ncbi:hypothetical protein KC867_01685 [Candidatus Saccharibacteria bacterium]|nr:hypothetical protein [Candidatus Saccharibacteria bacterium]